MAWVNRPWRYSAKSLHELDGGIVRCGGLRRGRDGAVGERRAGRNSPEGAGSSRLARLVRSATIQSSVARTDGASPPAPAGTHRRCPGTGRAVRSRTTRRSPAGRFAASSPTRRGLPRAGPATPAAWPVRRWPRGSGSDRQPRLVPRSPRPRRPASRRHRPSSVQAWPLLGRIATAAREIADRLLRTLLLEESAEQKIDPEVARMAPLRPASSAHAWSRWPSASSMPPSPERTTGGWASASGARASSSSFPKFRPARASRNARRHGSSSAAPRRSVTCAGSHRTPSRASRGGRPAGCRGCRSGARAPPRRPPPRLPGRCRSRERVRVRTICGRRGSPGDLAAFRQAQPDVLQARRPCPRRCGPAAGVARATRGSRRRAGRRARGPRVPRASGPASAGLRRGRARLPPPAAAALPRRASPRVSACCRCTQNPPPTATATKASAVATSAAAAGSRRPIAHAARPSPVAGPDRPPLAEPPEVVGQRRGAGVPALAAPSAGTSGRSSPGRAAPSRSAATAATGSCVITCWTVSAAVSARNGGRPVSSS